MTPTEETMIKFIEICLREGVSEEAHTQLQSFINMVYHEGYFNYKIVDLLCDILEKTKPTNGRYYLLDQ